MNHFYGGLAFLVKLNKMNKFLLVFFISLFFIFSCGNDIKNLSDEYLLDASKGNFYSNTIKLSLEKVVRTDFKVTITPEKSGIYWIANDEEFSSGIKDYNYIIIKGNPLVVGEIYIDFDWYTYGTNMRTGKHFKKRYILKVEE
nr:hypothetical protein [Aggregatibacter actinomycetemcomitans]